MPDDGTRKRAQRDAAALVGRLLRDAREATRLRQVDVAEAIGRQQQYISSYESGGRRLDLFELWSICDALGLSLTELAAQFEGRWSKAPRRGRKRVSM